MVSECLGLLYRMAQDLLWVPPAISKKRIDEESVRETIYTSHSNNLLCTLEIEKMGQKINC